MTVTVSLRIEPELCGPFSLGTVAVIKLLARYLELALPEAMSLVDRCVFEAETVRVPAASRDAAAALLRAANELPAVPRVVVEIIEN